MKIRIMSSNIWGNCPVECPIADRDDKMAAVFHRHKPDVIGIQECSPKVRKETRNIFTLTEDDYAEVPVEPINSKKNDYTPIIYRKAELDLIDFGWHLFDGLNDAGSKSITWALFETKKEQKRFVVINTHFYWKKTNFGRATRINNTGSLMYYYWLLSEKYDCPIFVTGDFNCTVNEPPLKTLMMYGLLSARYSAKKSSPYSSHHAYPKFDSVKDTYTDGTMPSEDRDESIDHIFVGGLPSEKIKKFTTVTDKGALEASDHCPIFVEADI